MHAGLWCYVCWTCQASVWIYSMSFSMPWLNPTSWLTDRQLVNTKQIQLLTALSRLSQHDKESSGLPDCLAKHCGYYSCYYHKTTEDQMALLSLNVKLKCGFEDCVKYIFLSSLTNQHNMCLFFGAVCVRMHLCVAPKQANRYYAFLLHY